MVKECDLRPFDYQTARIETICGQPVETFGRHKIPVTITDGSGKTRTVVHEFTAATFQGHNMILGHPWLSSQNPDINWKTAEWSWSKPDIEIANLKDLEADKDNIQSIYAVFWTRSEPEGQGTVRLRGISVGSNKLPERYEEYSDVFSEELAAELADHAPHDHEINTEGKSPPYGPIYSLSSKELEVLRKYLDTNLERGWIRKSISPAGAPILFVNKKDGGLRLCVDYRGLNQVTVKNRYPLPLINETLDRLQGATVFTKLDLRDAYHRIRIKPGDEWKTAFRTRYGHFEYTVLPFGLANAPASFQAYINGALHDLLDRICVAYMDDILVYSKTEKEHEQHVKVVLERLRRYRLFAKLSKCSFHTSSTSFLGFVVKTDGIVMEEDRVDTIRNWPEPKSLRDVQVFLGLANFYRRFVQGFSKIAEPLTGLMRKDTTHKASVGLPLDKKAKEAFETLKGAFTSAPCLIHYDPFRAIRVETDASGHAIAAVLSQQKNHFSEPNFQPEDEPSSVLGNAERSVQLPNEQSHWHPVAFWSRKMSPAERNYEVHDQELLAIVKAFKHWRHYLEGSRFTIEVITDHNNLRHFMREVMLSRRQARWAEQLSAYDLVILYRKGQLNPADAPSRRPDYCHEDPDENSYLRDTLRSKLQNMKLLVGLMRKRPSPQEWFTRILPWAKLNREAEIRKQGLRSPVISRTESAESAADSSFRTVIAEIATVIPGASHERGPDDLEDNIDPPEFQLRAAYFNDSEESDDEDVERCYSSDEEDSGHRALSFLPIAGMTSASQSRVSNVKSFDEHSDLYSLFYTDLKSYFLNTGKVQGLYNNETLESKT